MGVDDSWEEELPFGVDELVCALEVGLLSYGDYLPVGYGHIG